MRLKHKNRVVATAVGIALAAGFLSNTAADSLAEEDDHGWQFLTGKDVTLDDAMIVSMREIVEHDRPLLVIPAVELLMHLFSTHCAA
jgi:hypothetical protein